MSPPEFFRDISCLPGLRLCRSILYFNRITNDLQTGLDRGCCSKLFIRGNFGGIPNCCEKKNMSHSEFFILE
jgi:hypothetical protein